MVLGNSIIQNSASIDLQDSVMREDSVPDDSPRGDLILLRQSLLLVARGYSGAPSRNGSRYEVG